MAEFLVANGEFKYPDDIFPHVSNPFPGLPMSPPERLARISKEYLNHVQAALEGMAKKDDSKKRTQTVFRWARDTLDYAESQAGVDQNLIDVAQDVIRLVAAQPNRYQSAALYIHGIWSLFGLFEEAENHQAACEYFAEAANLGYARAYYRLASELESQGNSESALWYYEYGVGAGDAACMYRMGMAYLKGHFGKVKDVSLGLSYLEKSSLVSDPDCPQSSYMYGLIQLGELPSLVADITPDYEKGLLAIERAAWLGFGPAMVRIGQAWQTEGEKSRGFDAAVALRYFHVASRDAEYQKFKIDKAHISLGGLAEVEIAKWFLSGSEGCGLCVNEEWAYKFARLAAEEDNAYGVFAVGYCHEVGIYVSSNIESAIEWYEKARLLGSPDAIERLKVLKENENEISRVLTRKDHERSLSLKGRGTIKSTRAARKQKVLRKPANKSDSWKHEKIDNALSDNYEGLSLESSADQKTRRSEPVTLKNSSETLDVSMETVDDKPPPLPEKDIIFAPRHLPVPEAPADKNLSEKVCEPAVDVVQQQPVSFDSEKAVSLDEFGNPSSATDISKYPPSEPIDEFQSKTNNPSPVPVSSLRQSLSKTSIPDLGPVSFPHVLGSRSPSPVGDRQGHQKMGSVDLSRSSPRNGGPRQVSSPMRSQRSGLSGTYKFGSPSRSTSPEADWNMEKRDSVSPLRIVQKTSRPPSLLASPMLSPNISGTESPMKDSEASDFDERPFVLRKRDSKDLLNEMEQAKPLKTSSDVKRDRRVSSFYAASIAKQLKNIFRKHDTDGTREVKRKPISGTSTPVPGSRKMSQFGLASQYSFDSLASASTTSLRSGASSPDRQSMASRTSSPERNTTIDKAIGRSSIMGGISPDRSSMMPTSPDRHSIIDRIPSPDREPVMSRTSSPERQFMISRAPSPEKHALNNRFTSLEKEQTITQSSDSVSGFNSPHTESSASIFSRQSTISSMSTSSQNPAANLKNPPRRAGYALTFEEMGIPVRVEPDREDCVIM